MLSVIRMLEFNRTTRKVKGFGDCDVLSGDSEVWKDSFEIGALAVTRMACPVMDVEQRFLSMISGNWLTNLTA